MEKIAPIVKKAMFKDKGATFFKNVMFSKEVIYGENV